MPIINCTPHAITIYHDETINDGKNVIIPPSGLVVRVEESVEMVGTLFYDYKEGKEGEADHVLGLTVTRKKYGNVENLPSPKKGTIYLVSAMVRQACPDRVDLFSPGDPVRDSEGKIVGCKNLVSN